MKRRDFVQLLALSGFSAALPLTSSRLNAQSMNGNHRYLVTISADGGWDTTCLFDPKGRQQGVNNVDLDNALVTPEGIRWSAIPGLEGRERIQEQYRQFFTQYGRQLTAIRGVDSMTTSHVLGMKGTWSGNFGTNPAIGALYGAVHGARLPLSYVTFGGLYGGNDYTAGLSVTKARLRGGDLLKQMGSPRVGQRPALYDLLSQAHLDRLGRQLDNETRSGKGLQLRAKRMEELLAQRMEPNMFSVLHDNLSQLEQVEDFSGDWNPERAGYLKSQARIAAASFATGVTSSASLNMGGFDTHGNNNGQYSLLGDLLEGIHYLVEALNFYGLANQTVIMVASDIGRLPFFNASGGKDHYNVTGQMIIHPKPSGLGGRYFGQSTDGYTQQKIDMNTGRPDTNGTLLTTRHTLLAMREYLNLNGTPEAAAFPLNTQLTPQLFG